MTVGEGGAHDLDGAASTLQGPSDSVSLLLSVPAGRHNTSGGTNKNGGPGGTAPTATMFTALGILTAIAGKTGGVGTGGSAANPDFPFSGGGGGRSVSAAVPGGNSNSPYSAYPAIVGGVSGEPSGRGADGISVVTAELLLGLGGGGGGFNNKGDGTGLAGDGGNGGVSSGGGGGGDSITDLPGTGGRGGPGLIIIWAW